jgi:hypothetical protein
MSGAYLTPNHIIVTNCTSRKRVGAEAVRFGKQTLGANLRETAQAWRRQLQSSAGKTLVSQMYVGRSISEAKWVAARLHAPLHVVSAGLGLVSTDFEAPSYDLTISGADSRLNKALAKHNAQPSAWWRLVSGSDGLQAMAIRSPRAGILIALPATYLDMVVDDLASFSPAQIARLRIFTSQPGRNVLPLSLVKNVMPYDDRLESVGGCAGTRADFPQRAMRHFVERLEAQKLSLAMAHEAVTRSLGRYSKPKKVERTRADDQVITRLIREQWKTADGRSTALLRYLRDEAFVSCEQSRFAQLFRSVRDDVERTVRR